MFFKTRSPIEPVDFVRRIIQEVVEKPGIRRMRYINRLTPTTLIGKATEKGLDDLLQTVLPEHFQLAEPEKATEAKAELGVEPEIQPKAEEAIQSEDTTKGISGRPSVSDHSQRNSPPFDLYWRQPIVSDVPQKNSCACISQTRMQEESN